MDDFNDTEIEIVATGLDSLMASPQAMIARTTEIANAFRPLVESRKLSVKIQGKDYIVVEGWTTLGVMLGIVPHEVSSKRNDDGSFEAVVELRTIQTNRKVGGASALCGTPDDRPWNKRPEPARKSMACTRATGKAFRLGFSFIVKLAGYEVTPAEEMPSRGASTGTTTPSNAALREQGHGSPTVALPPLPKRRERVELTQGVIDQAEGDIWPSDPDMPDRFGPTEADEIAALEVLDPSMRRSSRRVGEPPARISEKQRKMLFALAKKANLSHDRLKGFLDADFGVRSTKDIQPESFSTILDNIEGGAWK
jgi:hypothetical protein